jgi:hypothetical protein
MFPARISKNHSRYLIVAKNSPSGSGRLPLIKGILGSVMIMISIYGFLIRAALTIGLIVLLAR